MVKTQIINDGGSTTANVPMTKAKPAVKQVTPTKVTVVSKAPAVQVQPQQQMPAVQVQRPQPQKTLTPSTAKPVQVPKGIQPQQQIGPYNTNVQRVGTPSVQAQANKIIQNRQQTLARSDPNASTGLQRMGTYLQDPNAVKKNEDAYSQSMANQMGSQLISKVTGLMNTARQGSQAYLQNQIRHSDMNEAQKERYSRQVSEDMENAKATEVYNSMLGAQNRMAENAAAAEENLTESQKRVSQAVGSAVAMLPDMILSYGVGTALGIAGEGLEVINTLASDAALGQMFLSATGNAIQAAKDEGFDDQTATKYALTVAAIEIATEKMSGGLSLYGKSLIPATDDIIEAGIKRFSNPAVQWFLHNATGVLGEGFEEFVSEIADAFAEKAILGKYEDMNYGELLDSKKADAWNSFLIGALSALFMNTASGQYSNAEMQKYLGEAIDNFEEAPNAAKEAAVEGIAAATGQTPEQVTENISNAYEQHRVQEEQERVSDAVRAQMDPDYVVDEYDGQQIYRSDYEASQKGQDLKEFGRNIGRNIAVVKNLPNNAEGMWYNGKVLISEDAFRRGLGKPVAVKHELLHSLKGAKVFNELLEYANQQIKAKPDSLIEFDANGKRITYASYDDYMNSLVARYAAAKAYGLKPGATWDSVQKNPALADIMREEATAFWVQNNLFQSDADIQQLVRSSRSTAERIWQTLKDMIRKWSGMDDEYTAAIRRAERMFAKALSETQQTEDRAPVALDEKQNPQRDYAGRPITPEQAKIQSEVGPNVAFSIPTFRRPGAKGKYSASVNNNKGGFAGLSEIIAGKDVLRRTMAKKGFSPVQADTVVGFLEHMANHLQDETLQAKYNYIGWQDLEDATVTVRTDIDGNIVSVAVSAMVANGEYPVNFDLTTICNKREGIMQVIQELANIEATDENGVKRSALNSVKLTDENMWHINEALKAEGIDTACLGCFVEARRYYTNNFVNKIDEVWNAAVRDARERLGLPTDGEDAYFNFAEGKKPTKEDYMQISELWTAYDESTESKRSPSQRIKVLMDEIVRNGEVDSPYLKYVQASDVLTPEGIRGFKELSTHRSDRDMVKLLKSIYGTSAPKEILAFTPYNSEIALLPDKMKNMETGEYLKSIGGTRVQSFSDFKMEHFFDHMQMVADEAARGFPNHGYSKVIAYPRLFGLTGRKINMSVMFDVLPAEAWQKQFNCTAERAEELAATYQGLQFVTEIPEDNVDNRPYKPVTIEGVDGYLTYLLSDADAINAEYERLYQENLAKGMDPEEARRQANRDKPFEQSINYREAVELENRDGYKNNVGIVAVSYGDEHFRMLLDDPNVRYIIPYHRSGLPVFVASKTSLDVARDYTMRQNTAMIKGGLWKRADGSKVYLKAEYRKFLADHPDAEFPAIDFFRYINEQGIVPIEDMVEYDENGNPVEKKGKKNNKLHGTGYDVYQNLDKALDIREISNEYLEWCLDKNYAPVFFDFAGHPNYYKVLFDFAVTDADGVIHPQGPVRNIYPGLNLEELSDEIAESGMSAEEFLAANEDRFGEFYAEIERALAEQNAKNERRAKGMPNVLSEILSQDSENSIIAGSNIQSIQYDTPDYNSVKYGAGQSSLLPAAMFSLPSERYNSYADIPSDVEGNYGYHAGDLGRAESRGQQGYYRGTGHYGTGTYFVGNPQELRYGYENRPVEAVDFSNYNLFAPQNSNDAYTLHEYLKALDGGYGAREQIDPARIQDVLTRANENAWGRDYGSPEDTIFTEDGRNFDNAVNIVHDAREIMGDAFQDVLDDASEWDGNEFSMDMSDFDLAEYPEVINSILSKLDEDSYNPSKRFYDDKFIVDDMYRREADIARMMGVDPETVRLNARESDYDLNGRDPWRSDSRATQFMKNMGYEGIDTRALPDFDNTRYGSVIYDLKGRDLERKNANGPRFALADFRQPSYEELIKKKSVEPVDLTNINVKGWDFNSSAEKNYERLGLLDKPILNDDTNEAIFITKNAINHIIHDDDAVSIQGVLLHLPELIRIAKLVDVAPERNPRSGATGAYTFISAGNNQYGTIPVELKVIEYPTGKQNPPANIKDFLINNRLDHYSSLYDGKGLYIEKIDLGKNLGGGTLTNGGLPIIPKSIISVEELLSLVNKDKQNLIPLPEEKMLHVPLEQRLFGDDLLNAYDLISELKDNGAAVDENGYVTVYHRTNSDKANSIIRTQKMIGKEDNIFFSTNPQGSNNQGYGNAIIRLTVPVEDLVLDDIFGDEASVSIPIKDKKNLRLNVQKYKPTIYDVEQPMFSLSSTDPTAKRLKKTYGSKMSAEEISNRLNELFHSFDTMDFSEAEREELAGYIARDIADMIPTRKAISTESQHVLNTLKDITIRLTDSQKSEARHAFGDLREFQKAIAPVKMRNDGEMLTDAWLDWSQDSGSNGMIDTSIPEDSIPSALAELVGKLKDTHEELDYDVLEEITSDILEAYNNQEADVSDLKDPGEIDEFKDMYGDGEGIRSIDSTGIAQKINGNKRMNGFDSLFRTLDRAAGGDKEVRTWFDKMIERPMYEAHRRYNEGRVKAYDELQDIVDKYGIKAGTKESAAIQWYGEGYRVNEDGSRERYGLNKLKQEFPDSWEKIQEAEGWFRNKYDEYVDRINSVLEQIYPDVEEKQQQKIASIQYNIDQLKNQADDIEAHLNRGEYSSVYSNDTLQYVIDQIAREEKALAEATKAYESGEYARNKRLAPRKDYFHHFQDVSEKGIGDLKNLFRGQEVLIDTNLVGISDTTKPKSRWMGFLQHQGKGEFTADAVGGMARYMPSAEYAIAFDPAIAHMRSVVTSLRDSTKKTRNANGLISYLSNFTNDLAGKTAGIDRAVTNFLGEVDGRATLDAIRKLNSRFKANAVGANVRSALAQFSNLPNGIAIVKSNSAWLKGIRDYADFILKGGSDILDQSVFMTERYFDGDVSQFEKPTLGKKISDASNWMLEFGDKQAARLIWFSAYEEAMEKGLDDPVYYADRCTQQAVAGRGVGEVPYNMSSKMVNLFAPFQVEVNNTWQQLKKMTNERDARGMMRFMLSSWVFEGMMESLLGIDVIPDIFGTVVDTALKLIGGGDDDDDEEESVRAILTQGVREAIGQIVSAIPGASLIAQNIFGIDSDTGEKLFGEGNPSRYGVGLGGLAKLGQTAGDVVEAIANDDKSLGDVDLFGPLVETLMPFGGRQLTRSYKTAQDYGVVPSNTWGNFPFAGGERNTLPGSYTSKGALRFELPTDDPWEMAKAFLLGEYATDAGREYLENGRKTVLTQKQVEAMNEYAASGGDPHDYMQFIQGANTDGNSSISQAEAQEYLDGTNLDDDQKSLIWSLYGTNWKKNPYAETPSEETPSGEQAETSTTEDSTPKLTEAKQTKLDEYVAAGHDQQGMLDFYSGADADGNGRIKQEEAIEWFETSDLDDVQKALIWNLMWPKSAAKNPYD